MGFEGGGLTIFFSVNLLAVGQSYDYPATLNNMVKSIGVKLK